MFRGFQITSLKKEDIVSFHKGVCSQIETQELLKIGRELFKDYKDTLNQDLLASLKTEDGMIDGEQLESFGFPKFDAEVFISHSHADTELATLLAGRLKRDLDITSFVDSNVWEYRDRLIEMLARFSNCDSTKDGGMAIAAHVDCMLNKAIVQMMDDCECLFFLNTPNSVTFSSISKSQTLSPWLASELAIYSVIRKKSHDAKPKMLVANNQYSNASGLKMTYDLRFDNVFKLDAENLFKWIKSASTRCSRSYKALSELYELSMYKEVK